MRSFSHGVSWASMLLAVFSLGTMAGFFGTYSSNVNLATRELDGPTCALVQSAFNRNVRHAVFFAFFFGPPLCCALALAGARRAGCSALLLARSLVALVWRATRLPSARHRSMDAQGKR